MQNKSNLVSGKEKLNTKTCPDLERIQIEVHLLKLVTLQACCLFPHC